MCVNFTVCLQPAPQASNTSYQVEPFGYLCSCDPRIGTATQETATLLSSF